MSYRQGQNFFGQTNNSQQFFGQIPQGFQPGGYHQPTIVGGYGQPSNRNLPEEIDRFAKSQRP
jgi:hypothetical protein